MARNDFFERLKQNASVLFEDQGVDMLQPEFVLFSNVLGEVADLHGPDEIFGCGADPTAAGKAAAGGPFQVQTFMA